MGWYDVRGIEIWCCGVFSVGRLQGCDGDMVGVELEHDSGRKNHLEPPRYTFKSMC